MSPPTALKSARPSSLPPSLYNRESQSQPPNLVQDASPPPLSGSLCLLSRLPPCRGYLVCSVIHSSARPAGSACTRLTNTAGCCSRLCPADAVSHRAPPPRTSCRCCSLRTAGMLRSWWNGAVGRRRFLSTGRIANDAPWSGAFGLLLWFLTGAAEQFRFFAAPASRLGMQGVVLQPPSNPQAGERSVSQVERARLVLLRDHPVRGLLLQHMPGGPRPGRRRGAIKSCARSSSQQYRALVVGSLHGVLVAMPCIVHLVYAGQQSAFLV